MDLNSVIGLVLNFVPVAKPYVQTAISLAIVLPGAITALVAAWRGIVALIQAVSNLPYCGELKPLAVKLLADQDKVDNDSNKIIQELSKLSSIKLPQGK